MLLNTRGVFLSKKTDGNTYKGVGVSIKHGVHLENNNTSMDASTTEFGTKMSPSGNTQKENTCANQAKVVHYYFSMNTCRSLW